jgi:hypothetical protein
MICSKDTNLRDMISPAVYAETALKGQFSGVGE